MNARRRPIILATSLAFVGAACQSLTGARERDLISGDVAHDGGAGGEPDGGMGAGGVAGSGGTGATNGAGGEPDGGMGASGAAGSGATSGAGGESGAGAGGSAGTANLPTSCAELAVKFGVNQDGPRTIDRDGAGTEPPFDVICVGMTIKDGGAATEYLVLPRHNGTGHPDSNFVTFTGDTQNPPRAGACDCPALTSDFSAVRMDLGRLRIFAYDRSFRTFRGNSACHGDVAHPCCDGGIAIFGEAASCVAAQDTSGSANIDLRGTPFHLAEVPQFDTFGEAAAGSVEISDDRKVATVRGGGLGGGYAPIAGEVALEFDAFTDLCGTETPASVVCGDFTTGATLCAPAVGCCTNGSDFPMCNGGVPSVCEARGYRAELFCDDQADCSDGKVCCQGVAGGLMRSTCKTDCFGTDVQLCTTCRECKAGKTCAGNRCVSQP